MRELLNKVWKKEEGFSLIELIIVIAILAIIAAIAVPNLLGNIKKANEASDISNAKLIADAIATAVAQTPTLEGVDFAGVSFGVDPVAADISGTDPAKAILLMDAALVTMNNTIPTIKSSTYEGTDDKFYVTITAPGQITVTNTAAAKTLFPVPTP